MRERDGGKESEREKGKIANRGDGIFVFPPSAKRRRTRLYTRCPAGGESSALEHESATRHDGSVKADFDEAARPRGSRSRFTRNLT